MRWWWINLFYFTNQIKKWGVRIRWITPFLKPNTLYISLAHRLAGGNPVSLGKLFLGEVYWFLHLTTSNLLSGKKPRIGGPWWFIQLWAHLNFQRCIPNLWVLVDNSFPDEFGRQIRSTSYGQGLYSLPGSRLHPKDVTIWFKIFFQGLDNPLFFPYYDLIKFENPTSFRLDNFANDSGTRHLYSLMILPCFLQVGMNL